MTLTWNASDATPLNYSILVNDSLVASGPWNGSDIQFVFSWSTIGMIQVTLYLFDIFGNYAFNTVIIQIRSLDSITSSETFIPIVTSSYSILSLLIGIISLIFHTKKSYRTAQ
ncbi:MAG: hypothetical protein ACFFBD_12415 [Candidatus Hodarchaeota archaeon]